MEQIRFLNTFALKYENLVSKASERYGSQSIGVQLQIKKFHNEYEVMTESGRNRTFIKAKDWIRKLKHLELEKFIIIHRQ